MIQGNNRTFEDLFRAMIPTVVVKSTKRYEKRLSDLLTNIDTTCCQKNHEAREFLASIGLPAAIESVERLEELLLRSKENYSRAPLADCLAEESYGKTADLPCLAPYHVAGGLKIRKSKGLLLRSKQNYSNPA